MKSILSAVIAGLLITTVVAAQRTRPPAVPVLPPISMTCVHHPDVLESKPGVCPYCKLPLVPVRLDSAWMCPVHTTVTESNSGKCRMCGRQLVPVTVSLTWSCAADRATEHLEPGTCTDGSPRIGQRTLRAHGNHNPQHGGQFFMAPDNWHHLEGVHPAARVFRLYLYDDYGRPLAAAKVKDVQARVVTKETFDPATRKTTELSAFGLKAPRNRPYLEARIDPSTLPAEMTAKVKFGGDQPEYRFDFTFASFSKEPAAPTVRPSATQPVSQPETPAAPPAPSSSALDPLTPAPIPTSMSGMLEQLGVREKQVGELIARGDFAAVWVPAFQAKDIAIALEPHVAHLSPERRDAGEPALARVVRTAWLLDAAGDVGNRSQIEAVYTAFKASVTDVLTAFGEFR
jgi:Heavy metal binding domain